MYAVIELQTDESGSMAVVTPIETRETVEAAESLAHQKLAAAAVSSVPIHTVVVLNEYGTKIMEKCYRHAPEEGN